ncbi:FmdB family zinc ribbon protein [Nonomuraea sp. SYSU D8015]|uniref:FmdB family zinc ribbon protein n=1 Tax=Nonomuraea sp. SYSU D8015 TaxID=2593644 RepID=UPI001660943A|nr:zinc ribbon domain-containing protein [Nonomuraea sp. SYSU D8015]
MPRYEFRCRACGSTFEVSRPMSASDDPAACPEGHDDTVKLLSTVAMTGGAAAPRAAGGGGCCGGGCCSS